MTKKVIVAGCRNYTDYPQAREFIDNCIRNIRKEYTLVFISGGCKGADALGERYALENGFKIERYNAMWDKYGKAAGPLRNKQMVLLCDYIICFWDGKSRGTKSTIKFAIQMGKPIKIKKIA